MILDKFDKIIGSYEWCSINFEGKIHVLTLWENLNSHAPVGDRCKKREDGSFNVKKEVRFAPLRVGLPVLPSRWGEGVRDIEELRWRRVYFVKQLITPRVPRTWQYEGRWTLNEPEGWGLRQSNVDVNVDVIRKWRKSQDSSSSTSLLGKSDRALSRPPIYLSIYLQPTNVITWY